MSLAAFTNEPGEHRRYEGVSGFQSGQYYGWFGTELIYYHSYIAEDCLKWFPTPGYAGCTDWSRSIRKVTNNSPMQLRRYSTVGTPPDPSLTINLVWDDHISNYQTLGAYVVPDPGYDNGKDQSITSALNNLASNSSNWGENLGQARKTIDEFSHAVERGGKILKVFKNKDFSSLFSGLKNLRDAQKTAADLWLEYSYGWKPLASDIYELQQAVHGYLKAPAVVTAKGGGRSSNEVSFLWAGKWQHHGSATSSHRTFLSGNLTNPELHLLNQAGLANPVSIAWELVPWSFALDWFIPVGQTLQACTAGLGLSDCTGFTSSQTHDNLSIYHIVDYPDSGYVSNGGDYQEMGFSFHRQCHASLPLPRLYANPTPYRTERALNALALVRQLV
jgi:hypothetical protein